MDSVIEYPIISLPPIPHQRDLINIYSNYLDRYKFLPICDLTMSILISIYPQLDPWRNTIFLCLCLHILLRSIARWRLLAISSDLQS